MNIEVVLEGKLKESYFKSGVDEYKKRISSYLDLKIIETSNIEEFSLSLRKNDFVVTLEILGRELSSIEFANKLKSIEQDGFYNKIIFLIGGSNGLPESVRRKSNFKFSMSKLTFLHQEAVLILVEQIYRAIKILKNEPYHK